MSESKPAHIITLVGLAGSGKSSAVAHLADKHIPKINASSSDDELLHEIHSLINSGQRTVSIDGVESIDTLLRLKHEFPGLVDSVAVVSSRHHRLLRKHGIDADQLDTLDRKHVEHGTLGAVIALADHFIINDSSIEDFYRQIDELTLT